MGVICPTCQSEEVYYCDATETGEQFNCGVCHRSFWLSPTGYIYLVQEEQEVTEEEALARRAEIRLVE